MKRLNPETGLPFVRGYVREDGRVFKCYTGRIKKNGMVGEHWTTPDKIEKDNLRQRAYAKNHRIENLEIHRERNRKWREANKERKRAYNRSWELANPEKAKASKHKYALANREKKNARSRQYSRENPHIGLAHVRARQARLAKRTPPWFNSEHQWIMKQAYELAKIREKMFGFKWHVDHIVPLKGKTVSGLHVPWNIQVIPAKENWQKSNRWLVT